MRNRVYLLVSFLLGALIVFSYYSFFQPARCGICLNGSVMPVFSPNSDDEIIGLLRSARSTIDVEMYIFTHAALADELIAACSSSRASIRLIQIYE